MRKKLTALLLATVMIFSLVGTALAEDLTVANPIPEINANLNDEGKLLDSEAKIPGEYSIKNLPGYQQLLQLRAEAKTIREQIARNQKAIVQAILQARQAKKDIATVAKAYREKQKTLRSDLKTLWATQKQNWQAMKAARQAKNKAGMETAMNQILATRTAINAKLTEVKAAQEQLLVDLQNAPQKTKSEGKKNGLVNGLGNKLGAKFNKHAQQTDTQTAQ